MACWGAAQPCVADRRRRRAGQRDRRGRRVPSARGHRPARVGTEGGVVRRRHVVRRRLVIGCRHRDFGAAPRRRVTLSRCGPVAQWSEQGTHNPSVDGSIPSGPTHPTWGNAISGGCRPRRFGPVVTVWSPFGHRLITDALDEVVERRGRDARTAPDVHELELAGGGELVHGGAPDAKPLRRLRNRQQEPVSAIVRRHALE